MIAYDFETTPIDVGTPQPLYLTAYGEVSPMHFESRIRSINHLGLILENYFLTDEYVGVKFVAWNGNNFDAYFVAAALVLNPRFILRPFLTRSNSLRGLRVTLAESGDKGPSWEFLDGIAMLGLVQTPLADFLDKFAPKYRKLKELINFEAGEHFDYRNPEHRAYAMRDSEGLYHGMMKAQSILLEKFDQPLAVTMGGACIKIFKANIPENVVIPTPKDDVLELVRDYVMRGGFCYCVKRYQGPVWKYDINQAYAAAMRESPLPAGYAMHTSHGVNPYARIYIARLTGRNPRNKVPFYYRTERDGRMRSVFATTHIEDTWLTSTEVQQLQREGWKLDIAESWCWEDVFSMTDYVNALEAGRMSAEGGPSGSIGTMFKNVGNHSYGKTVEQLEPVEYILAPECPPGFQPYYPDEGEPLEHVYFRFVEDQRPKDYHQPQIGAFITAHVRMVVRRAALIRPDAWLYADTDCVVFSSDVTAALDIDKARYGAWKIEEAGAMYQIIAKKVYAEMRAPDDSEAPLAKKLKRSAKGLNVKKVTPQQFDDWYNGEPPTQQQIQRQNFLMVMRGAEMYRAQQRRGTAIEIAT